MAHEADADPPEEPTAGNDRPVAEWVVRRALVTADLVTVGASWLGVLAIVFLRDGADPRVTAMLGWSAAATLVTLAALSREQLYLSRVWAIRAIEVQRVGRAGVIAAAVLLAIDAVATGPLTLHAVMFATGIGSALVLWSRVAFESWVGSSGRQGDRHRVLLLTGDVDAGRRVLDTLKARPELGYRVAGVVSTDRPGLASSTLPVPWVGTVDDLAVLMQLTAATAVTVVGNTLESEQVTRVLQDVKSLDVHADLVTLDDDGVPRFRVLPLSRRGSVGDEPALSRLQRIAKRTFDLVAGTALALVALPVVLAAAALLKLATGGPAFVRDVRQGPRGESVVVRRLRTRRLPDTPLARWVGDTSRRLCIDELPQLGNVLGGSMTLVGPRPLPRNRQVTPVDIGAGLIGLRHMEAADSATFGPHRRTDEFYVENWSVGLDLSIIAASVSDVAWRTLRHLVRGQHRRRAAAV